MIAHFEVQAFGVTLNRDSSLHSKMLWFKGWEKNTQFGLITSTDCFLLAQAPE